MALSEDKFTRSRLRSSYLSVVVSIALVLFVLGTFGALVMNARQIARQVKENFTLSILLDKDASTVEVREFEKSLLLSDFVKDTKFISKEEAAQELEAELDEEFLDFLGENPLSDAIEVHLKARFVEEDELQALKARFESQAFVREAYYDPNLIKDINDNIKRLSFLLIGGTILLSLVAIGLINSSIRLAIYSRRFLIKTMQLVGATKSFIRRPFLQRSISHGLLGALIAILLLAGLFYYFDLKFPGLLEMQDLYQLGLLVLIIIGAGIFISFSCTYLALKKYLKLKTDQLYY